MSEYIGKYFNFDLAQELDLERRSHRIMVKFIINESGGVDTITVRAPHPRLVKEVKRILEKLPKLKPAKVKGKRVRVKYVLPVNFRVI